MFPLPHVFFSTNTSFCLFSVSSSDVPGGFSVSQGEEPREGGDLHLTCVANKYLYTALSWLRVNDTEDTHSSGSALSSHQLTSGEFSNSLVLLIKNLTARDSGAYRCSAHHLITGQETHLDTQVVVTSEYCSHSLMSSSSSSSSILAKAINSFTLSHGFYFLDNATTNKWVQDNFFSKQKLQSASQ